MPVNSVGQPALEPDDRQGPDRVGSWVTVIMGGIFVVCVLVFRRGIVGELRALLSTRRTAA